MPFRQLQKYYGGRSTVVVDFEQKTLENGNLVFQAVNQSEKSLPKRELFELENQLKAGVNLEEVNSKVIGSRFIDGDALLNSLNEQVNPNKE